MGIPSVWSFKSSSTEISCCGGGGAQYWYEVPRREKMSGVRLREAAECGAGVLVSECPYCLKMLGDGIVSSGRADAMRVRDIAEVVAESLGPAPRPGRIP